MSESQGPHPDLHKATRLVEYLLKLAQLRMRLIRDVKDYQPHVLWLSSIPREVGCFTRAWGSGGEHETDDWIEVQSRPEPQLPEVPSGCKDWVLSSALRDKNNLPEILPQVELHVPNPDWHEGSDLAHTTPRIERLERRPDVQRAWDGYLEDKWLPWVEQHNAWEAVHEAYSSLFAMHQSQLRLGEEYELVLAFGLLTWETPTGQRVRRHLIVADAILEFEARLARFTVRPHTDGAKLRAELDMLDIEDQPPRVGESVKVALAECEDDPWDKRRVEGVLQTLVNSIRPDGIYHDSLVTGDAPPSSKPVVEYAPALILRKRTAKGLIDTLNSIRDQIESGVPVPVQFADLAELSPNERDEPEEDPDGDHSVYDGEIFFPKPSNEEQRRIVDMIRGASGTLVQGPPGTGKSHTIANLICHLLATGQRILVTAKTPRALQVLEGLLPEDLLPLCINLLGSGREERRSLESSVGGILRKSEEWIEEVSSRQLAALEERLRGLREEKVRVERHLRDIREAETYTHDIAGIYRGTAARIAEAVNCNRLTYEWFADLAPLDQSCPVSSDELRRVLAMLRRFSPEVRRELALSWPDELPSSDRFASLIRRRAEAAEEVSRLEPGANGGIADHLESVEPFAIEELCDRLSTLQHARTRLLSIRDSWIAGAVCDTLGGNASLWHELLRVTREVVSSIESLATSADETRVQCSGVADMGGLYEDVCVLTEHLENGKSLGWWRFRPKPVRDRLYVLKDVAVSGQPCSSVEDFKRLRITLFVHTSCDKAWEFWRGRAERIDGPYALQLSALKSLCDALAGVLALEEPLVECRAAIQRCPGTAEPLWADESSVTTLHSSCRLALARIRHTGITQELQGIEDAISRVALSADAHPVSRELLNAVRERDADAFARLESSMKELMKERQALRWLDDAVANLRAELPKLAAMLEATCDDGCWDERVQGIEDAWEWAQARFWVEEYINTEDVPALSKRLRQVEQESSHILAQLAALNAWSFCFSRLTEAHRRHMEAWQQAMRRVGKRTGKYATRHLREAQVHLNECREAVPAWVMPLHRVWDTVAPAPKIFDVIVVDEASQCGVEALPLFYLGKKVLIVGDDKQISPDAVGVPREAVHHLMEEFLNDYRFKDAFSVESSLFDHGKLRYGKHRITLREHFRCMPEIIRFSNDLCYSDTPLIPLRQYGPDRLPPLERVFVESGYREGSSHRPINRPEAEAIVAKIAGLCSDRRYEGKTMGVVVLQGDAQAELIESLLLKELGGEEMQRRRLVCGNPYSFQGDERDVIFLSLVAATNVRIGPLSKAADERRLNVAASRARDQMILFHSVRTDDLSALDLRRQLLQFFENTRPQQIAGIAREELERKAARENRQIVKAPHPFDSWFEVDVALELLRRGYTVLAQHEVAGKRIDLVVEGGQARLAVECDGAEWHGPDQDEYDTQRQRQLERCGWEFFRVTESAFKASPEYALSELWGMLEERGIVPNTGRPIDAGEPDLADRVVGSGEALDTQGRAFAGATNARSSSASVHEGQAQGHRTEAVTVEEIQRAIVEALSKCPNRSCTLDSLTTRVLKELGLLTRGKPREAFNKRTLRCARALEDAGRVEIYRAKNRRVRLVGPAEGR